MNITLIGWSLVHFLWQGALIALALALCLRAMKSASANSRYVVACAALVGMTLCPVVTYNVLVNRPHTLGRLGSAEFGAIQVRPNSRIDLTAQLDAIPQGIPIESQRLPTALFEIWLAGAAIFTFRLIGGWTVVRKMAASGRDLPMGWSDRFAALQIVVGLKRKVRYAVSATIKVPCVIGAFRPMVLIPASAFTGLSPDFLLSLIAHELAHVRRMDYVVNAIQSIAESLLYYHPAVWWLSARIRQERENCCDDVAVAAIGSRKTYASALAALENWRQTNLVPAANGSSLAPRIRRILEDKTVKSQPSYRVTATPVAISLLAAIAAFQFAANAQNQANGEKQSSPNASAKKLKQRTANSAGLPTKAGLSGNVAIAPAAQPASPSVPTIGAANQLPAPAFAPVGSTAPTAPVVSLPAPALANSPNADSIGIQPPPTPAIDEAKPAPVAPADSTPAIAAPAQSSAPSESQASDVTVENPNRRADILQENAYRKLRDEAISLKITLDRAVEASAKQRADKAAAEANYRRSADLFRATAEDSKNASSTSLRSAQISALRAHTDALRKQNVLLQQQLQELRRQNQLLKSKKSA